MLLVLSNAHEAARECPGVDRLEAAGALGLKMRVSEVKRLMKPFEVENPRGPLAQDPEVVPEEQTRHDVDRVLGAGYEHEEGG